MNFQFKKKRLVDFFHYGELSIYAAIGLLLLITSFFLLYNTLISLVHFPDENTLITWIVDILDKTLLILMILEILYTVRVSFNTQSLCAEPFLIVALIASVRRILVISVESAHLPGLFNHHMIEIGILGILIIIFVISIILLHKYHPATRSHN